MNRLKYKPKSFRLNEETINNLEILKQEEHCSYNMLFLKLIKEHYLMKNNNPLPYNSDEIKEHSTCPYCHIGTMRKKTSRYGGFLACDQYPRCAYKKNIDEELDVGQAGYKD